MGIRNFDPTETLRKGKEPPFSDVSAMEYTNWIEEQHAWHHTCGLTNMTYMLYLHVEGRDALQLFADTSINSFDQFPVGSTKHAVQCNEDAKVISEGLVLRLAEDEFVTQGFPAAYLGYMAEAGGYDVTAERRDTHVYEVEGPNALPVMEELTDHPLTDIGFLRFETVAVAGHEVIVLRHGMSGEIGFELHVDPEDADAVYEAIRSAGEPYGLRQVGMKAALTRGYESGQPQGNLHYIPALYADRVPSVFSVMGSFDADGISAWYRSPVECGWGHYTKLDHDFIGRDALEAELEDPSRVLVTLVWDEDDVTDIYRSVLRGDTRYKQIRMPTKETVGVGMDEVRANGRFVGTSSYPSCLAPLGELISMSTIDIEHADPGTEVAIVWGEGVNPVNPMVESHTQKRISATVAPAPYADERRRADLR